MLVPLILLAGILAFVLLGADVCICLCVLSSFGMMPFVNSVATGPSRLPYWLISFGIAAIIMLAGFAGRALAGERVAPFQPGVLLWVLLLFAAYTLLQMQQSDPMSAPSIATPFIAFPLAALVTFVWLLHDHPLSTLQKSDAAGNRGGGGVGGDVRVRVGRLFGLSPLRRYLPVQPRPAARRQPALHLGAVLVHRLGGGRGRAHVPAALQAVGFVDPAGYRLRLLQDSRAEELALAGSLLVLLVWKFIHVPGVTRVAMAALLGIAVYVAVTSPVGQHIVTGVQGLSNGSGTGGYRVQIAQEYSRYWTFLGGGITLQNLDLGYNVDLGIPNTILVLGFLGAGIQVWLLLAAVGRGLLAKSTIGIALAAVIVMVLLARPTLPLIETGPGAIAYGMTIGAIAALYIPRGASRRRIATSRERVDTWRRRRSRARRRPRPRPRRYAGARW